MLLEKNSLINAKAIECRRMYGRSRRSGPTILVLIAQAALGKDTASTA